METYSELSSVCLGSIVTVLFIVIKNVRKLIAGRVIVDGVFDDGDFVCRCFSRRLRWTPRHC